MKNYFDISISPDILKIVGEIDEFKGKWEALGHLAPERLSRLRQIATIESISSSTRIEGVQLTDREVATLLSDLDVTSFRSRDEEEVAGYADLMEMIFESFTAIELTENNIKQLHAVLLKYSKKDFRHRGYYKTLSNSVAAFDKNGKNVGIIFKTAEPFDTPRLMTELLEETNSLYAKREHHVLLIIGLFIVRFLAIHPFQDGNGRLSRALTTLLLLRAGYKYVPYSSLERVIEENENKYYKSLRAAQTTMETDESRLSEWLTFFLGALHKQKVRLEKKLAAEQMMNPHSPYSQAILEHARTVGKITIKSIVSNTGINRNTVKTHIKILLNSAHLVQYGRGKGTWYELA